MHDIKPASDRLLFLQLSHELISFLLFLSDNSLTTHVHLVQPCLFLLPQPELTEQKRCNQGPCEPAKTHEMISSYQHNLYSANLNRILLPTHQVNSDSVKRTKLGIRCQRVDGSLTWRRCGGWARRRRARRSRTGPTGSGAPAAAPPASLV